MPSHYSLLSQRQGSGSTHGLYSIGVQRAEGCAWRQLVGRSLEPLVRHVLNLVGMKTITSFDAKSGCVFLDPVIM